MIRKLEFNKRIVSTIMSLTMAVSVMTGISFPQKVDAAEEMAPLTEVYAKTKGDWSYEIKAGKVEITGYNGNAKVVVIPDSIGGKRVTSIGYHAFAGHRSLESVKIAESVKNIGDRAFSGCSSLKSITIPKSVKSIGNQEFELCSSLKSIVVDKKNRIYDSRSNCNAIIKTSSNSLIASCQNTIIPKSVTSIGDYAFGGSSIKSIKIPKSVKSIGDMAFNGCSSLKSIVVDKKNKMYDSRNSCNAIIKTSSNSLIAGCQNTTIPKSVTSIGNDAFYSCSSLKRIAIPESVTSIGDRAFSYCTLKSITIPKSVKSIGRGTFANSHLKSITIRGNIKSIGDAAFYYCGSLKSITIQGDIKSIGDYAFYYCSSLKSIKIPKSVKSIGDSAFSYCSPELVVCCSKGSYAAKYAKAHNMKVKLI